MTKIFIGSLSSYGFCLPFIHNNILYLSHYSYICNYSCNIMLSPPKTIKRPFKKYITRKTTFLTLPPHHITLCYFLVQPLLLSYHLLNSDNNGMNETKSCFHLTLICTEDPKNFVKSNANFICGSAIVVRSEIISRFR